MLLKNRLKCLANPDLAHVIELQDIFQSMILRGAQPRELAGYLDSLDHRGRLACTRSLGAAHLRKLYDLVEGFRIITIDDLVPKSAGARNPVRHYGKNSLPAFTIFEKRFLRPEKDAQELWGYNHQALAPVTGNGYFIAVNAPDRPEVDIDYHRVPSEWPAGWPEPRSNERGISTLVYAYMIDKLRGVTEYVSIGRAWKKGKVQSAWFILCKE